VDHLVDGEQPQTALVHVRRHARVAVVVLDDPARRNALSTQLCTELTTAVAELEADDGVGAMVITGAGSAFCAGADLSDLGGSRGDGLRTIYEGFLCVARSPLPTLAAVNGAAVGAGMNLALACDIRLAGPRARFDCRFLDLGIHPGGGHTWMLRRLVGPQAAAAMVLFGQVLDPQAARSAGLVWEVAADDAELDSLSLDMAARAASVPGELSRATKATLAEVDGIRDHDDAVDLELVKQLHSMDQPAFAERLAQLRDRIRSTPC
jgi:enoyl-CoA hydratase